MLVEVLLNGLVAGGVYAISALGFVMVYRASNVMNFAHGELLMLGAYLAMTARLSLKLDYLSAMAFAIAGTALTAVIIEQVVIRRLASRPPTTAIIATLAVGIILAELIKLYWGPVIYPMPTPFGRESVRIFGAVVTLRDLGLVVVALAVTVVLGVFLKFTRLGTAVRAAAQNASIASLLGVRVQRVRAIVWALSGAMAAAAGVLIASVTAVSPSMNLIILSVFAAVILGGLNSLPGAIAGGLILGVLQTAIGFYVSTALKDMFTFSLLIVVLLFRPQGLFGSAVERRV